MIGNQKSDELDTMFEMILSLENIEECYDFFDDLCTIQELATLAQRVQVAKMLRKKFVYSDIVEITGASTATISRVNRSLKYGRGGYDIIFNRMDEKDV